MGPGPFPAAELGVQCARSLLLRQTCDASVIDEVIVGCTTPSESEMNIARVIGLRSGIANSTPTWTVTEIALAAFKLLIVDYSQFH